MSPAQNTTCTQIQPRQPMDGCGVRWSADSGDGGDPSPSATAYLNESTGDDGTAELGNPALPFATAGAAQLALLALPATPVTITLQSDATVDLIIEPLFVTIDGPFALTLTLSTFNHWDGLTIHSTEAYISVDPRPSGLEPADLGTLTSSAELDITAVGEDAAVSGDTGFNDDTSGAPGSQGGDSDSIAFGGGSGGLGGNAAGPAIAGDGADGLVGGHGYNMTLLGTGSAVVSVSGGLGGNGGQGGSANASGGNGGNGGAGYYDGTVEEFVTSGGNGGDGGNADAAQGGNGGDGGNGGNGGNITVGPDFTLISSSLNGGNPGLGGGSGYAMAVGGAGGVGGPPNGSNGSSGAADTAIAGSNGATGTAGSNGTVTFL
jgi:hypothetical protein